MKIEWTKVTWYSKLLAVILFLSIIPSLTFYIGRQYEITSASYSALAENQSVTLTVKKANPGAPKYGIIYLAENPGDVSPGCNDNGEHFEYACVNDEVIKTYQLAKKKYIDVTSYLETQLKKAQGDENASREYAAAIKLLNDYDHSWAVYIENLCSVRNIPLNVVGIGMWNTSGLDCQLDETKKYIDELDSFETEIQNRVYIDSQL